jgi:hypothetical protein
MSEAGRVGMIGAVGPMGSPGVTTCTNVGFLAFRDPHVFQVGLEFHEILRTPGKQASLKCELGRRPDLLLALVRRPAVCASYRLRDRPGASERVWVLSGHDFSYSHATCGVFRI